MTTARDLLKGSLRAIGAIAVGETPLAVELNDALAALNMMLSSWSVNGIMVYCITSESFNLVAGQASYTIGDGGDFDTVRPERIEGAFVRDSGGSDYPVQVIGADKYRSIGLKTAPGRPYWLHYNPTMPTGTIYTYPVADAVEALHIDSMIQLTQIAGLSTELAFPSGYEEALKYNLAIRLAPEYGKSVSAEVAALASSAVSAIIGKNAAMRVEQMDLGLPLAMRGRSGGYDIKAG